MSQLFLLRHGVTTAHGRYCGSTDAELTAEGWQQMWSAAEGGSWHRIISSPLRRCAHFAAALAQRLSLPYAEDARLREMHFGDWEGRSAAELMASDPEALRRFWSDPARWAPPGAEGVASVRARVLAFWQQLSGDDLADRVLVVTHGGPMRLLWAAWFADAAADALAVEVPYATLWDAASLLRTARQ